MFKLMDKKIITFSIQLRVMFLLFFFLLFLRVRSFPRFRRILIFSDYLFHTIHLSYIKSCLFACCVTFHCFAVVCGLLFFKINIFTKYSECQTVWTHIRTDVLSILIWVQSDCEGYQQIDDQNKSLVARYGYLLISISSHLLYTILGDYNTFCVD